MVTGDNGLVEPSLDARLNAFRPDLADARLEGSVEALRFVEGRSRRVIAPVSPLRAEPSPDSVMVTEALYGEDLHVFEELDSGWSWCQLAGDHYVGWVPTNDLVDRSDAATHWVSALAALVFPGPDIKLPPLMTLPMGARVTFNGTASDHNATYAKLQPSGFLPVPYLDEAGQQNFSDPAEVASLFLGAPYLWGGKTFAGLDCSGLIQVALMACGRNCPRDADMQEASLGEPLSVAPDHRNLRRNDLLFWPGHVGIMLDQVRLLHANAYHMAVAIEPLAETLQRFESKDIVLSTVRRLGGVSEEPAGQ